MFISARTYLFESHPVFRHCLVCPLIFLFFPFICSCHAPFLLSSALHRYLEQWKPRTQEQVDQARPMSQLSNIDRINENQPPMKPSIKFCFRGESLSLIVSLYSSVSTLNTSNIGSNGSLTSASPNPSTRAISWSQWASCSGPKSAKVFAASKSIQTSLGLSEFPRTRRRFLG